MENTSSKIAAMMNQTPAEFKKTYDEAVYLHQLGGLFYFMAILLLAIGFIVPIMNENLKNPTSHCVIYSIAGISAFTLGIALQTVSSNFAKILFKVLAIESCGVFAIRLIMRLGTLSSDAPRAGAGLVGVLVITIIAIAIGGIILKATANPLLFGEDAPTFAQIKYINLWKQLNRQPNTPMPDGRKKNMADNVILSISSLLVVFLIFSLIFI